MHARTWKLSWNSFAQHKWCSIDYATNHAARRPKSTSAPLLQLDEADLDQLDSLTTPETLETFKALYEKCVYRDTPTPDRKDGIKSITAG